MFLSLHIQLSVFNYLETMTYEDAKSLNIDIEGIKWMN